jgi:hypothetical protein
VSRERGFGTATWMIGVAVVVLPLVLALLSMPRWYERADLARGLAREVASVVVRSESLTSGLATADELVAAAAAGAGLSSAPGCREGCIAYSVTGDLNRGEYVTARVTVDLPDLVIPFAGSISVGSWAAVHAERVEDLRSLP